jgi:cytidine deaminase
VSLNPSQLRQLAKVARQARDNAYCPYSNHPVGAAILTHDGKVHAGTNVEIAHYKGVCAEASAISAMVSAGGRKISAVVVIGPAMEYLCTPCGDCRQRLREFGSDRLLVYSLWKDGRLGAVHRLGDLLPHSFGPENLAEVGTGPSKRKTRAGTAKKKRRK